MDGFHFWMAVLGFLLLTTGLWSVGHPNRVDASFSRGMDKLSLPWWFRPVFGAMGALFGGALVVLSVLV